MSIPKSFFLLLAPKNEKPGPIPGFAKDIRGEALENEADEADILGDQDLTEKMDQSDDENLGAKSKSLDILEEEPEDFLAGEVDVKEQMDRAANAMEASIQGLQNRAYEDSPQTELGAAFRNTPGGIEEVEMKTDQDLALHHHSPHARKRPTRKKSTTPS
ncbi:MAG TPA: hypothetical protein VIG33_08725 [Pseudobdellovibrionaceae bacterium]|jgi:hypothetical protein